MTNKALNLSRSLSSALVLVILYGAFVLFRQSASILERLSGVSEIADLGPDVLQPAFVSVIYIAIGIFTSTVFAYLVERQFRSDSFGTWSRFAVVFFFCFWAFITLSAAIL